MYNRLALKQNKLNIKYNINQILDKFIINLGIKLTKPIKVYYAWDQDSKDKTKQPKWSVNKEKAFEPDEPYFTIDYDQKKRLWHLGYIYSSTIVSYATIDDITGVCSLLND
jgi:hypothetical protein